MKIETGIPIPPYAEQVQPNHTPIPFPFDRLTQPGDSFLVAPAPTETIGQLKYRLNLAATSYRKAHKPAWQFSIRTVPQGLRVWRRPANLKNAPGAGRRTLVDFKSLNPGEHLLVEPKPGETPQQTRLRARAAATRFVRITNPNWHLGVRTTETGTYIIRSS